MKKLILLSALALLTSTLSFGQKDDVNLRWGELYKTRSGQSMGEIFSYDETGYYTYQSSPNIFSSDPFVEKYDKNFNKIASAMWTAKKSVDKSLRKREIEAFLTVNGKIVAISSLFDRKSVQRRLYWETLDNNSMQSAGDVKPFATYDMEAKSIFNRSNVYWTKSKNNNKYAFYSEIPRKRSVNEQMYAINVVDKNLAKVWEHTIRLPYQSNRFSIKDVIVDEGGTFYILGFNRFSASQPWGSFRMISITADGDVDDKEVSLPNSRYITSLHMEEDGKGDIICMGFFSDKITSYSSNFFTGRSVSTMYQNKGIFRGKFKDGEVKEMKNYEFPQDYIVKNFDKNSRRRAALQSAFGAGSGEAKSYRIRDVIFDKDGSSYLVAEQYLYRKVTSSNVLGVSTTKYHYYYLDLMVVKYDKTGNVLWSGVHPKGQMTVDDNGYYSGVTARVNDGNVYLLYNDNIKNYEGKKKDVMTYGSGFRRATATNGVGGIKTNPMLEISRKDIVVTLVKFDQDGNKSNDYLFSAKEHGAILVPQVTNADLDKWIVYSKRNKKEVIGEVQFK